MKKEAPQYRPLRFSDLSRRSLLRDRRRSLDRSRLGFGDFERLFERPPPPPPPPPLLAPPPTPAPPRRLEYKYLKTQG